MALTAVRFLGSVARAETLSRQAYAALRRAIRDGAIVPGVFYSEPQIAKALQISRTPVREALIELSREGIVEKLPQRGFRIRPIPDNELAEVFELREILETHVVRKLAAVATPEHVRILRRILEKQAEAHLEPGSFLEFDEEFHLTMARLLGLKHIEATLLSLRSVMLIAGAVALTRAARATTILKEHRAIVDRIAARDSAGATRAVRHHVQTTKRAATTSLGARTAIRSNSPRSHKTSNAV